MVVLEYIQRLTLTLQTRLSILLCAELQEREPAVLKVRLWRPQPVDGPRVPYLCVTAT